MNDEAKLISQVDLASHDKKLPDCEFLYFKFVAIGPNTLAANENDPGKICTLADQQPGFFLIGESSTQIREALHQLVDRFMDAQE